jgi:hypothetical protein
MLAIPEMKEIHDKVIPKLAAFFKQVDEQSNDAKL